MRLIHVQIVCDIYYFVARSCMFAMHKLCLRCVHLSCTSIYNQIAIAMILSMSRIADVHAMHACMHGMRAASFLSNNERNRGDGSLGVADFRRPESKTEEAFRFGAEREAESQGRHTCLLA